MMSDTDFERLKELARDTSVFGKRSQKLRKLRDFMALHAADILQELESRRRMVSLYSALMEHIDPCRNEILAVADDF